MENHRQRETIKCPECGHIQQAEVLETAIWNSYVHHCEKCGYTIMESEWEFAILSSEFYEVTPSRQGETRPERSSTTPDTCRRANA